MAEAIEMNSIPQQDIADIFDQVSSFSFSL